MQISDVVPVPLKVAIDGDPVERAVAQAAKGFEQTSRGGGGQHASADRHAIQRHLGGGIGVDGAAGVGHRAAAVQRQGSSIRRLQGSGIGDSTGADAKVRGVVIRVDRPLVGECAATGGTDASRPLNGGLVGELGTARLAVSPGERCWLCWTWSTRHLPSVPLPRSMWATWASRDC